MNETPEQKVIKEFAEQAANGIRGLQATLISGSIPAEAAVSVLRELAKEHGVLVYI